MSTAAAATAKTKPSSQLEQVAIELKPLNLQELKLTLVGDSPLISHKWDDKAKKQMLDKQMKKASSGKAAKDPQADYEASLYKHPDGGYGFPAIAFKAAAVSAALDVDLKKARMRAAFHINQELVKIDGDPSPREDMVRIGMGVADIRYRGEFKQWRTTFTIRYNASVITPEQIVNLFNTAGFGVGVGEWRPEKDGSFGMFHVAVEGE